MTSLVVSPTGKTAETNITNAAHDVPSRTDVSETTGKFSVATWKIHKGGNGSLELAYRVLSSLGVGVAPLQESTLTNGKHMKYSTNYQIVALHAPRFRHRSSAYMEGE